MVVANGGKNIELVNLLCEMVTRTEGQALEKCKRQINYVIDRLSHDSSKIEKNYCGQER